VLDEYLNILQSIQLPFALLPILHFTSSRRLMGRFANGSFMCWFGWVTVIGVLGVNLYLVATQIFEVSNSGLPDAWWMYLILSIFTVLYVGLVAIIVRHDFMYMISLARRKWKQIQRRRNGRGGSDADSFHSPLDSSSDHSLPGSAPMSLEEQFDQPEWGSPAWHYMERAAGREGLGANAPASMLMASHPSVEPPSKRDDNGESNGSYARLQNESSGTVNGKVTDEELRV
jgi:hypothetical protein